MKKTELTPEMAERVAEILIIVYNNVIAAATLQPMGDANVLADKVESLARDLQEARNAAERWRSEAYGGFPRCPKDSCFPWEEPK
jgi:hypothetical protein